MQKKLVIPLMTLILFSYAVHVFLNTSLVITSFSLLVTIVLSLVIITSAYITEDDDECVLVKDVVLNGLLMIVIFTMILIVLSFVTMITRIVLYTN